MIPGIRWIVVDGYNLLHRAGGAGGGDWRGARHRLIRRIERLAAPGLRVTVVFDGRSSVPPEEAGLYGVDIVYPDPSLGADIWIEQAVGAADRPAEILVVTSDLAMRHSIEAAGAATMSSGDFLERLDRAPYPTQRPASPPRRFGPNLGDAFPPRTG